MDVLVAGAEAGAGERKPREASEVTMLIRGVGGRRGVVARSCGHQEPSSVCEGREA